MSKINVVKDIRALWKFLEPITVCEIGSRGGAFRDLNSISEIVNYIGFEPDPKECEILNAAERKSINFRSKEFYPIAIGSSQSVEKLNITAQRGCSSFLKPKHEVLDFFGRTGWFEIVETHDVPLTSLDDFADKEAISNIDFLKIDVEGMELEILKGGDNVLRNLKGVRLEVNYVNHRENQTKFSDLLSYLDEKGFRLFGFLETHAWRPDSMLADFYRVRGDIPFSKGQVAHGDLLLFKAPNSEKEIGEMNVKEALQLSALLYSYGYLAHVDVILRSELVQNYLSKDLGVSVHKSALRIASKKLSRKDRCKSIRSRYFETRTAIRSRLSTILHR